MNKLFNAVGISKQSFHQYHDRQLLRVQESEYLKVIIEKIRQDHPTMGVRDMYYKIRPRTLGRDAFEEFCNEEGFMIQKKKRFTGTTDSRGVIRFDNLTKELIIDRLNQLWVSDITYYEVNNIMYFLTFVMDVYSRKIIGHSLSRRLTTQETTLIALQRAIKVRAKQDIYGLIFHSDGGGQYYAKEFLQLTKAYQILNSMCKYSWENPYAERINGVIKNNYLMHRTVENDQDLSKEVDRAVRLYNSDKPHKSLHRLTPDEFENNYFRQRETIRR